MGKAYIVDAKNNKLLYLGSPSNALGVFGEYAPKLITARTWQWVSTVMNNDTSVTSGKPDAFTITFKDDGSFNGS